MIERRNHPRIPYETEVWVEHPSIGRDRYATADISDSGLFLEMPGHRFQGGEVVTVQVCDYDEAPLLTAKVVRITDRGVGVAYVWEPEESSEDN